jgi:hypothetical protein
MFETHVAIQRAALHIGQLVADHQGGDPHIARLIKSKYSGGGTFKEAIIDRTLGVYEKSPADGLELWIVITRLLKERILKVAGPDLKLWLQIPQVASLFKRQAYFRTG